MKLRYETVLKSDLRCILKENEYQLDVDVFDLHSKHFGLFCEDQPAGYIRYVFPRNEHYDLNAFEIGLSLQLFSQETHNDKALESMDHPKFPFLNYPDSPAGVQSYYNSIREKGEDLIEPSRLTMFNGHKGIMNIAFMIECAIILYIINSNGRKYALVCCQSNNAKFYQRYGLQKIEGSAHAIKGKEKNLPDYIYESLYLSVSNSCLSQQSLNDTSIPAKFHSRLLSMYDEYTNHNQITREL